MKRGLSLVIVLFLLGASRVRADVPGFGPRPRRPIAVHPSNAVPIAIETGEDGRPARLLIPRSLLGRAKKVAPGERFGTLGTPIPVAVVLMLSVGLGLVGFRGRRFTRAPLMFLALLAVAGACTSILWANAPPPPPPIPIADIHKIALPLANGKEWKLDGVCVEITEDGGTIRLIVPKWIRSEKEPASKEKHGR